MIIFGIHCSTLDLLQNTSTFRLLSYSLRGTPVWRIMLGANVLQKCTENWTTTPLTFKDNQYSITINSGEITWKNKSKRKIHPKILFKASGMLKPFCICIVFICDLLWIKVLEDIKKAHHLGTENAWLWLARQSVLH